jgi:hypothetical protein
MKKPKCLVGFEMPMPRFQQGEFVRMTLWYWLTLRRQD